MMGAMPMAPAAAAPAEVSMNEVKQTVDLIVTFLENTLPSCSNKIRSKSCLYLLANSPLSSILYYLGTFLERYIAEYPSFT